MVDRIKKILAETFVLDVSEISDNITFGELEEWDSMGHVGLMMALQSEFGVSISPAASIELTDIPSIKKFIQKQNNK